MSSVSKLEKDVEELDYIINFCEQNLEVHDNTGILINNNNNANFTNSSNINTNKVKESIISFQIG